MQVTLEAPSGPEEAGLARKRATTSAEVARLRREEQQLRLARHPGVVELVGLSQDGDGGGTLTTVAVDGPTLAAIGPLSLEEVAGLGAALATTLADLHELGLVHGAVDATHVLVDRAGRPLLCSLGHSGGNDGDGEGGNESRSQPSAAGDVGALGNLLHSLVEGAGRPGPEVLRQLRPRLASRKPRFTTRRVPDAGGQGEGEPSPASPLGAALEELAGWASGQDGPHPPDARALAAAIWAQAPGAKLPRPSSGAALVTGPAAPVTAPGGPPNAVGPARPAAAAAPSLRRRTPARPRGGRALRPLAVLVGLAVPAAAVVASAVGRGSGGAQAGRGAGAPSAVTMVAVPAPGACPAPPPPPAADVDGDRCPDAPRYGDGVLVAGTARFGVGGAGDQVVVGRWDCPGPATVALLRRDGEVFVFDGWAPAGGHVVGREAGRVDGATSMRAVDVDGDGCDELAVERPGGPPALLHPAAPPGTAPQGTAPP